MGRKLFVGCSHTMGYVDPNKYPELGDNHIWQDNNYAEEYANQTNQQTVIYASCGAGNREYVNFVADAFHKYNDIDEVYVQSTYWGRFPLIINPDLDEKAIFPLDFFYMCNESGGLIEKYSIGLVQQDRYLLAYAKAKDIDYIRNRYIPTTSPANQPSLNQSSYMYMQMWHYCQTPLAQQDYFKDVFMMDSLCTRNNAKMYLWNINDRCFIPKETHNFYSELQSTTIADIDALTYLKQFSDKNLEKEKLDVEHYNKYVHDLIAKHYIPHLRSL
jgi:hypothetical protein